MKSLLRMAILGGAAVFALSTSAVAFAQTTAAPSPDGAQHRMVHKDGAEHHDRWMHRDPAEMQKHAAEHLRTMLQLTSGQEPALQTFLASMKPPEGERHMEMAASRSPDGKPDPANMHAEMQAHHGEMAKKREAEMAMTTPQRLDAMMKMMAERQAKMQAHVSAVKSFYAALTPPQQKVFDTLHGGMMGRGMHRSFGGHEGPGGPGMHGRGEMHMGMGPMAPMAPMSPLPPAPPVGER